MLHWPVIHVSQSKYQRRISYHAVAYQAFHAHVMHLSLLPLLTMLPQPQALHPYRPSTVPSPKQKLLALVRQASRLLPLFPAALPSRTRPLSMVSLGPRDLPSRVVEDSIGHTATSNVSSDRGRLLVRDSAFIRKVLQDWDWNWELGQGKWTGAYPATSCAGRAATIFPLPPRPVV